MKNPKIILLILLICVFSKEIIAQCPIIPAPSSYSQYKGKFLFSIFVETNFAQIPENLKKYFDKEMLQQFHTDLLEIESDKPILSFLKIESAIHKDYYEIDVKSNCIQISCTSDASCFYAINSFLQLIEKKGTETYVQNCKITDYPKFEWRGLHLDVSRHFFTVDEVKKYIDLMAFYKFNTFHWHLTDDQGWRIEIKKYPKLTDIGAWRDSTVNAHYTTNPRTYNTDIYGGFYTQEQVKEVVKYAESKYVNIVPEIEMPGHARAALAAYPEFSCTGIQQNVPGLWGVFDDIYCSKKETIDFNIDILSEVLELFPSKFIHVGGDEAPKDRWKKCNNCQKVILENNLNDEHELQSYFIKKIDAFLTSKGRKLIGWDEILEGGLSPNAAVMSWRGTQGGIEAVKQGHAVVMSPGSHCYFDHYQSKNSGEPIAFGGFTSLEKIYSFEPIPEDLSLQESKLILGAQANLWTEYIPNMKQLEYMTFPRALALSQVLWSVSKPSYKEFQETLIKKHLFILKQKDVNYSKAVFYPEMTISKTKKGIQYQFKSDLKEYQFIENNINQQDSNSKISFHKEIKVNLDRQKIPNGETAALVVPFYLGLELNPIYLNYKLHQLLGLPIKYITQPNERYSNNKELCLVDGILGKTPWNSSEWLGFDTTEINFEVNLLKETEIKNVYLSFLEDVSSWIHLPEKIIISTSTDQKKWDEFSFDVTKNKNSYQINKNATYIRYKIVSKMIIPLNFPGEGNIPWTFMDEIMINY